MIEIGSDTPQLRWRGRGHHCDLECDCGHWPRTVREVSRRVDGRRGRVDLDVIEQNFEEMR